MSLRPAKKQKLNTTNAEKLRPPPLIPDPNTG